MAKDQNEQGNAGNPPNTGTSSGLDERVEAAKDQIKKRMLEGYRIKTPEHLEEALDKIIKKRIQYNIDTSNSVVQQGNPQATVQDMADMKKKNEKMCELFATIAARSGEIHINGTKRFVRDLAEILINDQDNMQLRKNNIESLETIMPINEQKQPTTERPEKQVYNQNKSDNVESAVEEKRSLKTKLESIKTKLSKFKKQENTNNEPKPDQTPRKVVGNNKSQSRS